MTMTFRKFALNNVLRNKRLYAAYFISSFITVMVFFTFLNFAFHPSFGEDGMNKSVMTGMSVAGGIIYVFSFFFILYSMSSFLQSRKREFGILMMQGMSTKQVRRMVFLENMVIGFFATVVGIGLGLVFSKAILLIAENVLVLENQLQFYLPTLAMLITFVSFILLFFFISIFVTFILRTGKIATLIKGGKIGKSEPKASILLTILAVVLLGTGYALALIAKGTSVVVALLPVTVLVTLGTFLLFSQLNVFVVRLLKRRKALFWKKTNMLLFSDLSYRMKDNARAFFMVTIISTVAFSAIGTLVGLNSFLTNGIKQSNPYTFEYAQTEEDKAEIDFIEQTFDQYDLTYDKVQSELKYFDIEGYRALVVTPEQYNEYAKLQNKKPIEVDKDEVITVKAGISDIVQLEDEKLPNKLTLQDGRAVFVNEKRADDAEPYTIPEVLAYYIAGENIVAQLDEAVDKKISYVWEAKDADQEAIIEAGREISQEILPFVAVDQVVYDITAVWSPIMFVGLFIGIVFFVSAGSFLYFRLYTDLDEDREKFKAISKIGLTTKEMRRVLSKQIALLFFVPMIVAIAHGAVALTALSHMFGYNLVYESTLVLGSFFIVQVIYFIVVRYFYTKQIQRVM